METTLIFSNILSWIIIVVLAVMVYALSRQIGVLHERIKPVGALSLGRSIQVGEEAPLFQVPSLTGGRVRLGGQSPSGTATLIFFTSPTCPVCKSLLPVLKHIVETERDWLRVVFASDGVEGEHQQFIIDNSLQDYPYLLSTEVGMAYQISKLPYGVLINKQGSVSAHGLVNNREHLESLLELHFQERNSKAGSSVQEAGYA